MFKTGQALPLRERRTWCPRMSRGGRAAFPRNTGRLWTWHRPVHGLNLAATRTRTGNFRDREQSVTAFTPRQQACPRTIYVHALATALIVRERATATDVNYRQAVRSREQSTAPNRSRTQSVRDRGSAMDCARRCIAVSILPSINFPVHVRTIPAHVLI